ncbi:hypothetical protein KUV89_00690 [Marinobacter hydrocarbonoclasticus]|nr:hypothetical protein [Marinobacter nauticus]
MITALMLLAAAELGQVSDCQPLMMKCEEMAYRAHSQCLKTEVNPHVACKGRQTMVFDYCLTRVKASNPEAGHCFDKPQEATSPADGRPGLHP